MPANSGCAGVWALALLAVLTLVLLGWTVRGWRTPEEIARSIAQLQQQIAERDTNGPRRRPFLDLAANRSTRDQSQFLNGLIQRKAFSWTRVFEDLEQVMPRICMWSRCVRN
jgi:hypothetical protein